MEAYLVYRNIKDVAWIVKKKRGAKGQLSHQDPPFPQEVGKKDLEELLWGVEKQRKELCSNLNCTCILFRQFIRMIASSNMNAYVLG